MLTCPNCQAQNSDTARFCIHCATPLVASLTCPSCGTSNSPQAHFCMQCASPLRGFTSAGGLQTGILPPQTVLQNRYIILRTIGRGGMGAVYESGDQRIQGKRWAIKELSDAALPNQQEKLNAIAGFRQEAQMLATLSHPNLPVVSDFFSEDGKHYLVMEFIQGETLDDKLEMSSGFFTEDLVMAWVGQICDVLAYLHARRPPVIFRDLKPSNVMVDTEGRIKLIDFGIARFFKAGKASDTQAMGTPGYAAPEQFGKGQTDARSDVYSLGVLLHQLLTRYDPWTTPFNLPPPRNINPSISSQTVEVIRKATQSSPADRYQTVLELRQALPTITPVQSSTLPQPLQSPIAPLSPPSVVAAPLPNAQINPPAAVTAGRPPKVVSLTAWMCILTGVDIFGAIGGIAMLKGKNWGRVLGVIHLVLLTLAASFSLGVTGANLSYNLYYNNYIHRGNHVGFLIAFLVCLLCGIIFGILLSALYRSNVVEWFKPGQSHPDKPPSGIKIVSTWFLILSPGGLLTLPTGIGLWKYKKWGWWLAQIEAWLFIIAGILLFLFGISSFDNMATAVSGSIMLLFTWVAFYLLRKDIRITFGLGKTR